MTLKRNKSLVLFDLGRKQRKKSITQRPLPAPKPQPRPTGPRCRALYQYVGQDTDEISFDVNDVIDLIKEGVWVTPAGMQPLPPPPLTFSLSSVPLQTRRDGGLAGSVGGKACSPETTWKRSELARKKSVILPQFFAKEPPHLPTHPPTHLNPPLGFHLHP